MTCSLSIWLLACYGLTFLLADATVFARPRVWVTSRSRWLSELLGCYFCLGVWVSLGLWVAAAWPLKLGDWSSALLHVFGGATVSYVLDRVVTALEAYHAIVQLQAMATVGRSDDSDLLVEQASEQIDDQPS